MHPHPTPRAPIRPASPWAAMRLLHCLATAAVLLAALSAGRAWAQEVQAAEYRIKAAFLCKFGNYVEWPPAAFAGTDSPLSIGVLGPQAVADEVAAAARGQSANGRPVAVRRLAPGEPLDGLHVLFIARANGTRQADALAAVKDKPVLTVTETETEAQAEGGSGAVVNFLIVDDKVKFDVSLPAAERSNLKVSARLLGVARQVAGRPAP